MLCSRDVSRLRRRCLSDRFFFVTVRLLRVRNDQMQVVIGLAEDLKKHPEGRGHLPSIDFLILHRSPCASYLKCHLKNKRLAPSYAKLSPMPKVLSVVARTSLVLAKSDLNSLTRCKILS